MIFWAGVTSKCMFSNKCKTLIYATVTSEKWFWFSKRREFTEMLYKREGSSVSFQEKKSSPLRFWFTKYSAMLTKKMRLVTMPLCNVQEGHIMVWFWKNGTLGTKLFKQAYFFTKQAHFSRKCEFPCKAFLLVKVFSSQKTRVVFCT